LSVITRQTAGLDLVYRSKEMPVIHFWGLLTLQKLHWIQSGELGSISIQKLAMPINFTQTLPWALFYPINNDSSIA
jgi:hypothetical protein